MKQLPSGLIQTVVAFVVMLVSVGALVEARVSNIESGIQTDLVEIRKRVDEIYILLLERNRDR